VPFYVMEKIDGYVIRGDLPGGWAETAADRCAIGDVLIDTLADLHAIDPDAVGLAGYGRPSGLGERQVRRWSDQWERSKSRDIAAVDELGRRLREDPPTGPGGAIVHGDFRIDNTILDPADPGTVRALVDWEMATLGDPLADLGLHLAYADPAFDPVLGGKAAATSPRMPGREALARHYATATGREPDALVEGLAFYVGLGYFKAAVIAEGIHARHVRGESVGRGYELVGGAVAPLAAAGIAALDGSG
jgi:aminoglycoside phosphotransferase (APT) family kinase protein